MCFFTILLLLAKIDDDSSIKLITIIVNFIMYLLDNAEHLVSHILCKFRLKYNNDPIRFTNYGLGNRALLNSVP
jgi:hypothetical protein